MISSDQFLQIKALVADIPDGQLECEYKLYATPNDTKFSESDFYRIRDAIWDPRSGVFATTEDTTYDGNIRRTEVMPSTHPDLPAPTGMSVGDVSFMRKTRITTIHPKSDNLYLNVNREEPVDGPSSNEHPTGLVRYKERWTMFIPNMRIDMTRVTTRHKGAMAVTYEIELELSRDIDEIGANLMEINTTITSILKIVHQTNFPYQLSMKASIYHLFNSKFTDKNPPSGYIADSNLTRAEDLTPQDLIQGKIMAPPVRRGPHASPIGAGFQNGPPGKYGVSIKADGVRRFLIIYRRNVYLIGRPYEMNYLYRLRSGEEDALFIIEGELIESGNRINLGNFTPGQIIPPLFLAYDLIWANKSDISVYPYYMRLDHLQKIVQMFTNTNELIDVRLKEFYTFSTADEFFRLNNKLLDLEGIDYKVDGLMYTPTHASYRDTVVNPELKIFKWKPHTMLTIDFVNKDGKAYVMNRRNLELFEAMPNIAPHPDIALTPVNEYRLVGDTWHYVRGRPDKDETPNGIRTATRVLARIQDPITLQMIRGNRFSTVMRVDSNIKRQMYRHVPVGMHVVSIGAGRGGDLFKWNDAGVVTVDAVEPDPVNYEEFERRYLERPYRFRATLHRMRGQDFTFRRTKPTIIEFMLSLSFFTPEEVMDIVSPLKKGDLVMIYTINGDRVLDHFANPENYTIMPNGNYRSTINQIIFAFNPNTQKVYVKLPDTIVTGQTENLVPMRKLSKMFEDNGFYADTRFRVEPTNAVLNSQEVRWNNLFTAHIFVKK